MGTGVGLEDDAVTLGQFFFVEDVVFGDRDVIVGVAETGTYHIGKAETYHDGGDMDGVADFRIVVIDESALEVVVSAGVFVDQAVYLLHVVHLEALLVVPAGYVYQNVLGGFEVEVVEQRAFEGLLDGLLDAVGAGACAASHKSHSAVLHHRFYIFEVHIDVTLLLDDFDNAAHSSGKHLVGLGEGVVGEEVAIIVVQAFVVDDDHAVDVFLKFVNAVEST